MILNEKNCYDNIIKIMNFNNLNMIYIIKELYVYLNNLDLSYKQKINIVNNLSNIEKIIII